ncbi:MAG TPA: LysR family transcriptional regulator [Trebonia sp.]|nr:LysR family transcriptional regulator [Trebonia sp.]
MMLDLRRLHIFAAVAEGGSFTAAATALFLTQPAVSQQMAILEREVGVPLLVRIPRGIQLTEAGKLLAERTARLLAETTELEDELRQFGQGTRVVALGAFPTAGADLVPLAIREFRRRHPDVQVVLAPAHANDVVAQLHSSRIAVGLVWDYDYAPQVTDPAFERTELLADPLRVVLPAGHPAARQREVSLRDLAEEPWIVRAHRPPYQQAFEQMCRIVGFEPRIAFRTDNYQSIQGLVAAGIGLGLAPRLSLTPRRPDVVGVPVGAPAFSRRIAALAVPGASRPSTVDDLLDVLRTVADTLYRSPGE